MQQNELKGCPYITYKIENKTTLVVDRIGKEGETYDDFFEYITSHEAMYAVVEVKFETDDGRMVSKLVFISYISDEQCKVRTRMLYAGSKETLKAALDGVAIFVYATDKSELDYEGSVKAAAMKFA
jgi:cofilin